MLYIYKKINIMIYNNKLFLIIMMIFKYNQMIEIIKNKMNNILMKKYQIKILWIILILIKALILDIKIFQIINKFIINCFKITKIKMKLI
jgi:hypothetical protein